MPRTGLHPDVALDITLSATCSRNRYTDDPGPVIAELRALAGRRTDILARVAGSFAGYYDTPDTHTLCAALVTEIEGAAGWVPHGRDMRERSARGREHPA